METTKKHRPLYQIAREIKTEWKKVSPYALPYLKAMTEINQITDPYGCDSADGIVMRFLANAQGWRGDSARRIKLELNALLS